MLIFSFPQNFVSLEDLNLIQVYAPTTDAEEVESSVKTYKTF